MKTKNLSRWRLNSHPVVVLLVCITGSVCGFGESLDSAKLKEVAKQAYGAVRKGDIQTILTAASQGGVIVALRRADWIDLKKDKKRVADKNLTLDDLSKLVWEEREIKFDPKSKADLRGLTTALDRFRHNIEGTYGPITVALSQMDAWRTRELGPAASGKVASDAFWYIYFRRENGFWKIWKFEYAVH